MLTFNQLLAHSLLYGAILSVGMVGFIVATLVLNPEIWLDDAPADVKQAVGPLSPAAKRTRRKLAIPVFAAVIGLLVYALLRLAQLGGGALTFADAFLSTFLIVQVFNLVDLVLIDWLLICAWQPKFVVVPQAAGLAGMRDYGFHFRGFLKGLAGSAIASLLIAALASGAQALLS